MGNITLENVIYHDDIIIFSKTSKKHITHLENLFRKLEKRLKTQSFKVQVFLKKNV